MAADILGDEGALGDHLYFLGAQILQYVVHQLGADALPFVFSGTSVCVRIMNPWVLMYSMMAMSSPRSNS